MRPITRPHRTAVCRGLFSLALALLVLVPWTGNAEALYFPMNGLQLNGQKASKLECARRVSKILQAAHVYAMDHADQSPPSLQVLTNELGSPLLLFCPANNPVSIPSNWADVDWSRIDYEWHSDVNWNDPASVACTCRIHQTIGRMDGAAVEGDFRPGWPFITASPKDVYSTSGEDVRFEFRLTATALAPVSFQWRQEQLHYETNIVRYENPDDPGGLYWHTNINPVFTTTELSGETNLVLSLRAVQTNQDYYYSIAVSNLLGVNAVRARLRVGPEFAGCTSSPEWSRLFCLNNLKMLSLLRASWSGDHQGTDPTSFSAMTNEDGSFMFGWPETLFCRSDTQRLPPPDWSAVDFQNLSYLLDPVEPGDPYSVFCRCRVHGWYVENSGQVVEQPEFASIQPLPDGTMQLRYKVFAGHTNLLEGSADLVNWSILKSHYDATGFLQFTNPATAGPRFFRLRAP